MKARVTASVRVIDEWPTAKQLKATPRIQFKKERNFMKTGLTDAEVVYQNENGKRDKRIKNTVVHNKHLVGDKEIIRFF